MRAWTTPAFSTRNSTRPALSSRTALATSVVTVPTFGFGIRPLRTEHAAEAADQAHHVGRGDHRVELGPVLLLDLLDQVLGADGVGAGGLGLVGLVALGEDDDALALAGAVRQHDRAADHLVGVLGVDAQADGDVDALVELRRPSSRAGACRPRRSSSACSGRPSPTAFLNFFPCLDMSFPRRTYWRPDQAFDLDTHRARGARDGAHRRLEVGGVEVRHLHGGDVPHLLLGDLADLDLVGLLEPEPGFFCVASPAAFLIRIGAGGVLVMKVNERSE